MQVDKDASGAVRTQSVMGVGYVPLTPPGRERQGYTLF
jgi:ABC-type transporter Mla subunit MlaD